MKRLFFILTALCLSLSAMAQGWEQQMNTIDELCSKGKYESAEKQAQDLYGKMLQGKHYHKAFATAVSLTRVQMNFQEEWTERALARYNELLPHLGGADQALCHIFLMGVDTLPAEEHQRLALQDSLLLQRTPATDYLQFYTDKRQPESYEMELTPTLYDVVVTLLRDRTNDYQERQRLSASLAYLHRADTCLMLRLHLKWGTDPLPVLAQYRHSRCSELTLFYHRQAAALRDKNQYLAAIAYCDTAIALDPYSSGGVLAEQLRLKMLSPYITLRMNQREQMSQRDLLAIATVRNADTLYCFVFSGKEESRLNLKQQPVAQWRQPTAIAGDHGRYGRYIYIPALPSGDYILVVAASPTIEGDAYATLPFCNTNVVFVNDEGNELRGFLRHRTTGAPIAHQPVRMMLEAKTFATDTTDDLGYYCFSRDPKRARFHMETTYEGFTVSNRDDVYYPRTDTPKDTPHGDVFFDRPVYRRGDTVRFAYVKYHGDQRTRNHVAVGQPCNIIIYDCNGNKVDSLALRLDDFGSCSGHYVIPADGTCSYYAFSFDKITFPTIRIENYKQPKFEVSLMEDNRQHAFGDEVTVEGVAAALSGAPLDGAEVRYRVERRLALFWWWGGGYGGTSTTVASGTLTTDADGHFAFSYIPLPDSTVDLKRKPNFCYSVTVDVTDRNGETHSADLKQYLGYTPGSVNFDILSNAVLRDPNTMTYQIIGMDYRPVEGEVQVRLERLTNPTAAPTIEYYGDTAVHHTLSAEAFRERYPHYTYAPAPDTVEAVVYSGTLKAEATYRNTIPALADMPAGRYRLSITAEGLHGDTVCFVLMPPDAQQCLTDDLLFCDLSSDLQGNTIEVGDTLELRLATRHPQVEVTVVLGHGHSIVHRQHLVLNNEVRTLRWVVPDSLKGELSVNVKTIKDNVSAGIVRSLVVPYSDKGLDVRLATFRDKMVPGSPERWTVSVTAPDGSHPLSRVVMGMYDAALESYAYDPWYLTPWNLNSGDVILQDYYRYAWGNIYVRPQQNDAVIPELESHRWSLALFKAPRRMFSSACLMVAGSPARREDALVVNEEEEKEVVSAMVVEVADNRVECMAKASGASAADEAERPHLRTNLSTLGFFEPCLTTNNKGEASFSFTAPDLLTRWRIRGVAWTMDMMAGSMETTAVTQKQLMVQPNAPRFLRHGDSATIAAKVINLSDEEQTVSVSFASSISTQQQTAVVPAKGSASVGFAFLVPDTIGIMKYTIIAANSRHSDGEQASLPVLPARQKVSESMAMFINGKGEKRYTFEHLRTNASPTLQHESLTLEFTPSPVWLAVQSLPYVQQLKNPSNIYRFNAYYINSLGARIAARFDTAFALSPIGIQGDWRKTPYGNRLPEEPSVQEFFDKEALAARLNDDLSRLTQAQNSDGGWCWIPEGGQSSRYTTQYILTGFGQLGVHNALTEKALAYCDRETYQYYQKYIKGKKWASEADNIGYLYMRSFYRGHFPGNSRQVYDFYYKNAKKHYRDYTSLYTRAQLALIFYRHGDKALAREMVDNLRECALHSEEMGMYWRDNRSGFCWTDRPIEVQALLIEAFATITPDDRQSIAEMQQWLLKQKQTTHWESDIASVHAIRALLGGGSMAAPAVAQAGDVTVSLGEKHFTTADTAAPSGYFATTFAPAEIDTALATVTITKATDGIAWGAMYWDYYEDMDKIVSSDMGVTLRRQLFKVETDGSLTPVKEVHVGDRIRVRLHIQCDRNLEYLELKDCRAAGFEPVSTRNGWAWNDGLRYYAYIDNTATSLYINRLDKGKYIAEYDLYANNAGLFTLPPATLQCLYAPAFRATTKGQQITIQP